MSLYKNWEQSIEKATPANAQNMLEEYYAKEKDAYAMILDGKMEVISGKAAEIAEKLGLTADEFGAFADGINTSLETQVSTVTHLHAHNIFFVNSSVNSLADAIL